jgi:hypothetical protein
LKNFIVIALLLGVASCSPRTRLSNLLRKNPDLIESFTKTKVDTLKIPSITERLEVRYLGDTVRVDSLLKKGFEDLQRQTNGQPGQNLENMRIEFARSLQKLRNELISTITPDTVFKIENTIPVQFQDTTFNLQKTTTFRFENGNMVSESTTEPLKLPYEYSRTNLEINPVPWWKNTWFWGLIVSFVLNVLFIITSLRRRS